MASAVRPSPQPNFIRGAAGNGQSGPVERGELTPRGAELVMAQWQQERQRLEALHLLPPKACPSPSSLFVYADLDQRTQATAGAILLGLAPECAIPYATASTRMDPLFHPAKADVERLDRKAVERDILATAGGSLAVLEEELSSGIETVASVIGLPGPGFCMENRSPAPCSLMTIPSHVAFSEKGDTVTLEGRLGIAGSLAEIFLLEYGQWPGKPSGWGLADKTALQHMLPVHSRVFDTINRAPSVARAPGRSAAGSHACSPVRPGRQSRRQCSRSDRVCRTRHQHRYSRGFARSALETARLSAGRHPARKLPDPEFMGDRRYKIRHSGVRSVVNGCPACIAHPPRWAAQDSFVARTSVRNAEYAASLPGNDLFCQDSYSSEHPLTASFRSLHFRTSTPDHTSLSQGKSHASAYRCRTPRHQGKSH